MRCRLEECLDGFHPGTCVFGLADRMKKQERKEEGEPTWQTHRTGNRHLQVRSIRLGAQKHTRRAGRKAAQPGEHACG